AALSAYTVSTPVTLCLAHLTASLSCLLCIPSHPHRRALVRRAITERHNGQPGHCPRCPACPALNGATSSLCSAARRQREHGRWWRLPKHSRGGLRCARERV